MVNIRPLREEDLETLAQIYTEVYESFDVGERWDKENAHKLLSDLFNNQPNLAFVVESDGKIVGAFITGIKPWWDGNHLVDGEIFVHPDYQSKGIGRELFKVVFQTAIEKYDAKVCEGNTFRKPEFPKSWYKKLGFEEVEDWVIMSGDLKKALEILFATSRTK